MKKDNYNDAIKRKLESIEPEFQDSDWDEMKAFMATPPIPNLPMSRFYKPIGYGLTGIALLTSLYFNARHYLESNEQAQNTILNSKQQITDPTSEKTLTPEIIYQTDTVFIDRMVIKTEKIYISNPFDTANMVAQSTILNDKAEQAKGDEASDLGLKEEPNLVEVNAKESSKLEVNRPSITKDNAINTSSVVKSSDAIGNNAVGNSSVKNIQETNDINGIENTKPDGNTHNLIGLKRLNIKDFKVNNTFRFPSRFTSVKAPSFKSSKSHFVIRIPKINLENSRYRYGISLDAGNEQLAAGLTNELVLSRHWSVSGGLRLVNMEGKDYHTAKEYLSETKLDFYNTYAPSVKPENDIVDIKFNNYFLQIPLAITYRYPLRNEWTLLFGLGTELDIAGRQYVKFEYQGNSGEFEEGTNKANISNPVFNNGFITTGIEKKFGKYVFQLSPYASAQWKTSIYKRDDILLGAKLNLMYQPKRF